MTNPRQRRKSRSGSHKPVRHSNRAKRLLKKQPPIRGPKALQDAWDKSKTVRQNYEALGLVHSLNPTQSGGVEMPLGTSSSAAASTSATTSAPALPARVERSTPSKGKEKEVDGGVPKGYGRIIRDADGNILDVDLGEDEGDKEEEDEDVLVEEKAWKEAPKAEAGRWVTIGADDTNRSTGVVKVLEELSSSQTRATRHSSSTEVWYLQRLVHKHGRDLEAMARDRKLNVDQRTAGELGRAIKKAGGLDKLVGG
ncbi:hypothetical protein GLOTRDRAFT_57339 [Gloeophyllum trabeum ATCC 11539]|uniref:Nucleolar protein 16 n=1 Tax=Gloeophyllum trabeum (strain ATCC 11539 / FP-39264 / Madison 617) TaxID=670483 RepID=S7QEY5_GLOTA|nr:uncharacterized protein GLOTRDRAFT_57339 [Gloeophyllum trabeum ATCC 11539]EPQ58391.1 hypothetical protein GLOTRDRAFT_57339 [Gloeophyllum trabeum ATCC 11539]